MGKKTTKTVIDWREFVDMQTGLCGLCANTGVIDTWRIAFSGAGVHAGGLHFCICPNGRSLKKAGCDPRTVLRQSRWARPVPSVP